MPRSTSTGVSLGLAADVSRQALHVAVFFSLSHAASVPRVSSALHEQHVAAYRKRMTRAPDPMRRLSAGGGLRQALRSHHGEGSPRSRAVGVIAPATLVQCPSTS